MFVNFFNVLENVRGNVCSEVLGRGFSIGDIVF